MTVTMSSSVPSTLDLPNTTNFDNHATLPMARMARKRRNAMQLTPSGLTQTEAEEWMIANHPQMCGLPLPPANPAAEDFASSPFGASTSGSDDSDCAAAFATEERFAPQAPVFAKRARRNAVCLNPPNQTA